MPISDPEIVSSYSAKKEKGESEWKGGVVEETDMPRMLKDCVLKTVSDFENVIKKNSELFLLEKPGDKISILVSASGSIHLSALNLLFETLPRDMAEEIVKNFEKGVKELLESKYA